MKIINTISVVILFLLVISCNRRNNIFAEKDHELSLTKVPYTGTELLIDGYYYHHHQDPDPAEQYYSIKFLYRNGQLLRVGLFFNKTQSEIEDYFTSDILKKRVKEDKTVHGLFQISSNKIQLEFWYNSTAIAHHTSLAKGKIINDSTFQIQSYARSDGESGVNGPSEAIYHYKKFSPKPDSTNKFIP